MRKGNLFFKKKQGEDKYFREVLADGGKISIKVDPEAEAIMQKYFTAKNSDNLFDFLHRYSNFRNFVKSVNSGLKSIAEALNIK